MTALENTQYHKKCKTNKKCFKFQVKVKRIDLHQIYHCLKQQKLSAFPANHSYNLFSSRK